MTLFLTEVYLDWRTIRYEPAYFGRGSYSDPSLNDHGYLGEPFFFKVMGSHFKSRLGNFFLFSIIFFIKNCVENIKRTFYSNFMNAFTF